MSVTGFTVEVLHYDDPDTPRASQVDVHPFPPEKREDAFHLALYAWPYTETCIWQNDGEGRGPLSGDNLEAWKRFLDEHPDDIG